MLNKLINKLKISGNKKNIAKISSGTLLGQGITMLTLPIITRIYGAEIIGIWALLHSIAVIINSFSDLGLTNSIMVDEEANVEKNYQVITTMSTVISILASSVVTLYYVCYTDGLEVNLIFIFIFLAIMVFTLQQTQICYTWLNRNKKYNVLMKNPIINNGVYGLLAIILGLFGYKTYGYFIAYMIGQVITLWHMKRNLPRKMFTFKMNDYWSVFASNKRFVIYQVPTNIIGKFKSQLPALLVKAFWGTEMLGYYSISIRMLQIPSNLLASAIGRVFFQTVSTMKREGKVIGHYVFNNMDKAMKIAIIPMALLIGLGDIAAKFFLGKDWIIAGDFVRILALQYFFIFLMNTVHGLSITLDKQNYAMVSCIAQVVAYVVGASIGKFVFNNIYIALLIMMSLFIIINITFFCMLFKTMDISRKRYVFNVLLNLIFILGLSLVLRITFGATGLINNIYQFGS